MSPGSTFYSFTVCFTKKVGTPMTEDVRVRVLGYRIKLKVKYYIVVLTVMV